MVHTRLLVHAGARSSRKDDEQYINQAEAYAGLDSTSVFRRHLGTSRQHLKRADDQNHAQEQPSRVTRQSSRRQAIDEPLNGSGIMTADVTTYVEDTQLAYTALESQLPSSSCISSAKTRTKTLFGEVALDATTHVIDYAITKARDATPKKTTKRVVATTPVKNTVSPFAPSTAPKSGRSHSWHGDTRMSQSSYLVSPALVRSSKRRRVNEDRSPSRQRYVTTPLAGRTALPSTSPAMHRSSSQSAGNEARNASTNGESSELPTSYSMSNEVHDSLKRRPRLSQRSASDPGPNSLSSRESASRQVASQRTGAIAVKTKGKPNEAKEATSAKAVDVSRLITKVKETKTCSSTAVEMKSLSLVIQPPNAAVGQHFRTHVTPALQRLLEGEVAKCFKPTFESRVIDDLERGHWRMEIPDWHFEQLAAFWRNLERHIAGGHAGWGVWCSREQDSCLRSIAQQTEERNGTSMQCSSPDADISLGTIRVYCWGEVVKHIYLLLYVASNSKVRKLGLQWVDSKGEVVVQMPTGKSNRSK